MNYYTKKSLTELFQKHDLKPSSVTGYTGNLFSMARRLGFPGVPDDKVESWFDVKKFDLHYSHLKPTSKRNYFSSLIGLMKVRNEEDSKLFELLSEDRDSLNSEYTRLIEKKELSPAEKANWTDLSILQEAYTKDVQPFLKRIGFLKKSGAILKSSDFDAQEIKKIRDNVIVSMYLLPFHDLKNNFAPTRNDYGTLFLNKGKKAPGEDKNYLHIPNSKSATLIFNFHKTQRTHGTATVELPQEAATILRRWVLFMNLKDGDQVFQDLTKGEITNILQTNLKRLTGKKLGSSMLRKLYVSHRFGDQLANQKAVSENMMNSTAVQSSVYNKNV